MAADFAGAINSGARVERGNRAEVSMDKRRTGDLVLFAFDLVFLDGESTAKLPLMPILTYGLAIAAPMWRNYRGAGPHRLPTARRNGP